MNCGSSLSAALGALIDGIFLLGGQWAVSKKEFRKTCKLIFIEMYDNESVLDSIMLQVEKQPKNTKLTLPFDIETSSFYRHEASLVAGGNLSKHRVISMIIMDITASRQRIDNWCMASSRNGKESMEILVKSHGNVLFALNKVSKEISTRELRRMLFKQYISKYQERLDHFKRVDMDIELILISPAGRLLTTAHPSQWRLHD